jgi:hypothetical protein
MDPNERLYVLLASIDRRLGEIVNALNSMAAAKEKSPAPSEALRSQKPAPGDD